MGPFRQTLRTATRAAHDSLDALMGGLDLTDRDGYGRFLRIQSAALPPLEAALEAGGIGRLLPDWPARRRSAALLADLAALDLEPAGPLVAPPLESPAALMGAAYVLEGSRLGGAMMLRDVLSDGDPACRAATRFLGHGEDERLFASFLRILESQSASEAAMEEAARAARAAFDLFARAARMDLAVSSRAGWDDRPIRRDGTPAFLPPIRPRTG